MTLTILMIVSGQHLMNHFNSLIPVRVGYHPLWLPAFRYSALLLMLLFLEKVIKFLDKCVNFVVE